MDDNAPKHRRILDFRFFADSDSLDSYGCGFGFYSFSQHVVVVLAASHSSIIGPGHHHLGADTEYKVRKNLQNQIHLTLLFFIHIYTYRDI